jgi:glycosyltransferase involved in cell wall biosynthesis
MADGGGSGAGTFPILLARLLERGHRVDCFGIPGFTEPRSLERYAGYRFVDVHTRSIRGVWRWGNRLPTRYPRAAAAQLAIFLYQLEVAGRVSARRADYDLLLCTDALQLWPAAVPVISWPQSPPQSEAKALREPHLAHATRATWGARHYAAVQLYYAYRQGIARAALRSSDVYVCGSRWARDEWARFGAPAERLRVSSYLIDVDAFANVPPPGTAPHPTLLWLGRATPRKRLDLFLAGFAELKRRHPRARARVVGNLAEDAHAASLLAGYGPAQGVTLEPGVTRDRVPEIFAGADVLVQPSESENFGFSVAEALAAGRPVVLGPTNGTLDYADQAGFAFDAYEPAAVASAMERALMAVSSDATGMARKARAAAERHFRVERVVDHFEELAREVLRARRRPDAGS